MNENVCQVCWNKPQPGEVLLSTIIVDPAGVASLGVAGHGWVGSGPVRLGRHGIAGLAPAWFVWARYGVAGESRMARHGIARRGSARRGVAVQARHGSVRRGVALRGLVRQGAAGRERPGRAGPVMARQGGAGIRVSGTHQGFKSPGTHGHH